MRQLNVKRCEYLLIQAGISGYSQGGNPTTGKRFHISAIARRNTNTNFYAVTLSKIGPNSLPLRLFT